MVVLQAVLCRRICKDISLGDAFWRRFFVSVALSCPKREKRA